MPHPRNLAEYGSLSCVFAMPRSPVPWSVVIAVLQSTLYVYVCVRVCYERGVSNELIDAFVCTLPGGYGFPPGCRIHCATHMSMFTPCMS